MTKNDYMFWRDMVAKYVDILRDDVYHPVMKELDQMDKKIITGFTSKKTHSSKDIEEFADDVRKIDRLRMKMDNKINKLNMQL